MAKEISQVREVVAVSRANVVHVSATVAETGARRKGDNALSERQDDDNAVHAEMAHARTVFNLASLYESRSLDAIRSSIRNRSDIMTVRAQDAKRKLAMLRLVGSDKDGFRPLLLDEPSG